MIFRTSVRLCRRTFGVVDAATSPLDALESGYLARDIERLLGCDPEHARAVANSTAWRTATLDTLARRRPRNGAAMIAAATPLPAGLDLLTRLEDNDHPYVLALPYTTDAITLLAHVVARTRRTVIVEQTLLTQALMPLFRCEFVTPDVMIRRNRTRDERTARAIFVTFPDHHLTLDGTTRPVTFLGGEFHFSLAEVLLYVRGASPIVTLRAEQSGYVLDAYDAPVDPAVVREQDALSIVEWLAARLESVVLAAPAKVLSWRSIAQRTSAAARVRRILEGRMLQALVRIAPIGDQTRSWAMDRLRSIEESYREGEAA
jgi:hypothetical protein